MNTTIFPFVVLPLVSVEFVSVRFFFYNFCEATDPYIFVDHPKKFASFIGPEEIFALLLALSEI